MELLSRLRDKTTQSFIPLQASLELTNRCNERCTHCYLETFQDDKTRLLQLSDWERVLSELRQAGTLFIILMGGEAMLSPLFWPILKKSKDLCFHVSMISNGLKIQSLETAQKLRENGIQQITISLYSLNEDIHDKMTSVRGSCAKTQAAVAYCQKAGIEVGINCLLTRQNIGEIFDLEDWCMDRNLILKVDPNVTAKLDGNLSPTRYRATKEQLKWFYTERVRRWPNSRPKDSMEIDSSYVCNSAKGKCAITPYGELLPCIEIREPLGNLSQQSFAECWDSEVAQKWRSIKVSDLKNGDKNLYGFCEHCPGMAQNEFGDPLVVSQTAYDIAQIKKDVAEAAE